MELIFSLNSNNVSLFFVCLPSDINVDVDELNEEQKGELNVVGTRYGMKPKEYIR